MKRNYLAYGALILTVLIWGLSFVASKIALRELPPFTYVFIRLSLASFFFLILLIWRGFPKLALRDHLKLILIAFLEPGLYFTFESLGLQLTSASKASIIIALIPIFVLILARLILKERAGWWKLSAIAISVVGITILELGGGSSLQVWHGSGLGDLLILGAVFSAAFYTTLVRRLTQTLSPWEITSFQIIYGAVMYFPLFLMEAPQVSWNSLSAAAIWAVLLLVLFATFGAFLLYNFALSRIPASTAAVFLNGIPVVTAVGAWFVLGERLTPMQMGGGGLVLLAVYVANRKGL